MKPSSAGQKTPWQHIDKAKEKGDENTACRALLSARRPVTNDRRSRKPRFWLVLACGNRAVRFVCAGGSVRTTAWVLAVWRNRARAPDCHGVVPVVGSSDLRAGTGNPATCYRHLGWGVGDLHHHGGCAGCSGGDVETSADGR